jgi:hypothetical protein
MREAEADDTTHQREHARLDEKLNDDPEAACAERSPDGHLALA